MFTGRRVLAGGIVLAMIGLGIFALSGQRTFEGPGKVLPISFKLMPGSVIEQKVSAKIEEDNVELAKLLVQLRKAAKDVRGIDLVPFQKTYLRNPRLLTDDGGVYVGWRDILPKLKEIIDRSTYADIQSVRVQVAYVPYAGAATPKEDIDFKAVVRVRIACAPDDPPEIEGYLLHRRTCELEPGDSL